MIARINRNIVGATTLISLLLFLLLGSTSYSLRSVRAELIRLNADRFEYDVVVIEDHEWDSTAQDLGRAGWEIVSARRATGPDDRVAYECILRRKLTI